MALSIGGQKLNFMTPPVYSSVAALSPTKSTLKFDDILTAHEKMSDIKAYDSDDKEIECEFDSETGTMNYVKSPTKVTYKFDVGATIDSSMDVDININIAESSLIMDKELGPSGGGCETGLGIFGLMLLVMAITRKR